MTDLTLIGPLFTETTKTTHAKSGRGKPSAKGRISLKMFFLFPVGEQVLSESYRA